jgi:hypothetical protein
MSHLHAELAKLAEAMAELAAARVVMVAAPAVDTVIHAVDDKDDDDMGFLLADEVGEGASAEQRVLLASIETFPEDVGCHQALAAEAQARGVALDMRRAYVRDLATVVWMGRDHTRIDRENRELEEAIAARGEAVEAAVRDRARYHNDLAAVAEEEVARTEAVEEHARVATVEELARLACVKAAEVAAREAMVAAQRVQWDSALAKAIEHRRRARGKAFAAWKRSDNGVGSLGHASGQ